MVKVMSKFKYQMKSGFRHGFKNVIFSKFFFGFVASLSMIISSHDKAGRVKDNIDARFNENEDTFDFIVVGGGSAGSIVANRLSENHKVLLLEAGGEPHPLQRIPGMAFFMLNYKETDWMHRTVPQRRACFSSPNRRAGWSQGRNLGGSGNLNFMVHLRGSPRDYDYWAKITGDETWNYAGVLPYFRRHENYQGDSPDREAHGFDGELKLEIPSYTGMAKEFIRAGQELGYEHVDLNARYEEGFDTIYCPLEGGERRSSFAAFLEPIRDRETLVIRKYAHVNKILIRGFDNTAFGVEYDRHGRKRYAYATKEVILSAGTVESAKLLMLSGVGPKTHLADLGIPLVASLPVGRNLQDHLATFLGPFFIDPPRSYLIDRDITMKSFYEYKSDGNGPLSTSLFQAAAMISSKQAKHAGIWNWPDIQLLMSGMAGHKTFARDMAHAFHLNHKTLKKYYEHSLGRDSFFIAVSASRPLGRGEIVLEKKDPYAPTSINPRYLENDHDMHIMIEGIKTAMYLVENTTSFQNLRARFTSKKFPGCEHMSFRSDEYYECYVRHLSVSFNDPVGTCAMGNPHMGKDGVLDSQLQVIGVNHLRVIDASVMPAIVGSPTEAAVMMIAEKGADMILEAWRTRDQTTEGPHSSPNPHPPPHPATTYTQSGPLSANIDIAHHPGFEDGWKEFDPTKGFPTGFDDQPKGPQQSYGPPSDSVLPPVYNGPPPPGQYGPPQNNHNGGNFNNGPPPNNNYGPPNNNNNNSPPQDSYGIPQGPLSNNNNNNNNGNFPLIQDSYSLPPTQKPNGPPQDTYDGPPPQKPNHFSTTEENYNGPVQDSFDGPFKNNNFEGGYTGPPSDTYGVSVPIIQNNNGQPPWNFNGPNNNNNNNNNNEQNNYRNQNSFNGNGVSFGLSNNNNNNQFKFNENNNNNNGYTDSPQFTTSLKAPRPLSDDIDPRFNIPQDNEASTTETIANTISYESHHTDPIEENAPRGYEHMNMESSTNTPVSYDNTTGISGYLDDSTTSETITTTNRNLAVPLSFDTYTDTSSSTKVPSKFDGEYVLDQNQNKTQDPPRNAARPDVTLLTHDTKMRPGVQISNPFPDVHYAIQSQTTESSILSPSEFRLKYPITSSVEYPNKVPSPPELGPVYFRNPEYTTRRPILIGNATADGVPVFDAPGYNETVTADARVIALSQAEDRKHYRETNRRSANKNNLKPVVVYKSAGISNKVPTAASVPDIYYTMKDQSSMDAMSNSESASPSPYWTHQMTVTLTPRPRRLENEKGQESNQNSSPYWLNATPSSTSTPEEAITPWKPIDQSYPKFEDPPDYKAKKPAKISGLKKRPKDSEGSYSGRIVKIKSGPSWTTTMVPFSGSDSMTFFTSADSKGHGEGQNHNKIKIKIKHKNTRQDEDKGNDEIRPYFSQGSSLTSITIRRPKVKSNSKGQRGAKQVPYFSSEGFSNSNSNSPVTITPRPLLSVTIWPDDDMSKHYSHSSSKEAEDTFTNRKNSTKVKEDTFLSAPDFSRGQSSKEIQTDTSTYKKDGGLRSNTFITSEKPYFNEGPTKAYGLLGETDGQNSHDNNQNGKGDTDATNSPTMLISALAGAAMDEWTRSFGGNSGETYKSYQKDTDHISGNTDHYSGQNDNLSDVPSDNLKEDSRTLYHVSTTRQPQSQQINTGFTHTPTATPVFNTRVPEFFNQDSPKLFDTPPYPIDQNDQFRFQSPKDEGSENVQVPPWKPSLKLAKPEEQKSGEGFAQLIRNHYNGVDPTRFPTSFQEIPQTAAFEITTPTNEVYSSPVFDESPLRYGEATPNANSISEEGQSSTQSTNYRNKEGGRRRRPNGQKVRGGQRIKLNGGNNNFNGQNDNLGGQNNNFNGPNDNFSGQNNNFNGQNNNFNGQSNNFNGQNNHFTDQNNFNGQIDQTRFYGQSDQFSTQNLNGQTNLIRDGKQLVNNINNPILLESATTEPIAPFNQSNDNNNNFNFNQNTNSNDQTRNQRNPSNGLTGEFSNSLNSQSQQNYVGNQNFQNQGHTIPIVNDANNFQQSTNQNQFGNSQAGFQSFNSNQQSNVGQVPDFSGGNNNNNHNNVNNFGTNNNVGLSTPQPEQYPDFLDTFITPGTPAPFVNKHENVDLTVQSQESQQNFANNQNAHDFQQSNTQNFQQNQNNIHFQQDQLNNGQNNFNQNLNDHLINPNSNNFGQQHSNQNIQNVPPHATNNVRHFNSQQNSNDLGNFHTNSPDFGIPNFTVSPAPNHFAQSSVSPSQQPETFQNIRNNFPQNPDNDHINSNNNFQDNRQSANPPPPIITSTDYDSNNFEQTHFNPSVSNSNNNFQSSSTTDQNFNHHNTVPATATTFSETTNSNSRNFGASPPGITFQQGPGDGAFLSGTQAFDNGNFNQQQHLPKVPEFLGETEKSNTGIDTGTISLTYDDSGSSSLLDQPIIKDPNDQKVHIETSANLDADHISLTHDQQQGQIFQQGQNPQNSQNDGHFQQQNNNFQQNNFQQDHTISNFQQDQNNNNFQQDQNNNNFQQDQNNNNFQQDQNNNNFQHEIQTVPQTQVKSPHLPVDAFSNINNLEHTSVGQEQQNHDHFNGLLTNTGPPIHQSTAGTPRPLSFGSRLNGQRNRDVFADFGETIPTEPPLSFSTDFSNNGFTQQPFETFGSTAQFSSDQGLPFRGTERPFIQNQNDFSVSSQAPLQYTSNVTPSPRQREYTIFSDPDSVDITDDQFSSRFNHLKRRADILQQRRRKRRRNFLHAVRNRDAFDESEEEEDSVPFRRRPRRPHSRRRHRVENYPFAQKRSGEESPGEDKSVELSAEEEKKRSKDILEGLARLEEPIITEHQNKTKEKAVSLVPSIEKVRAALKAVPSKTKENKQPVPTHFSNVDSNINPTIPGQVIDPRSNLNLQGSQFSRKSLAIPTELNPENLLLDFSKSSAVSSGRKGKAVRSSSDRNAHVSFTIQPNNQSSNLNPQGSPFNSKPLQVSLPNQETLITNKTLQVSSKISAVRSSQSQQSETPIPNKGSLKNSESPLEPLIPNNPENLVSYKSPPKLNPNNLNFTSQGNFVRKIKVKVTTPMPVLQNAQSS